MKRLLMPSVILSLMFGLAACESDGPAEQAGEKIDHAAEKVGDKVEALGDKIENKTN